MTDHPGPPDDAAQPDDEVLAYAASLFDIARGDGDAETLADYLQHGLSPDLTNTAGDTLLLLAAYYRQARIVKALLAHGADPDRVNDKGQTALAAAVFRQDVGIVKDLLDSGADPLAGSPDALATAQFFGLPDMLALLRP